MMAILYVLFGFLLTIYFAIVGAIGVFVISQEVTRKIIPVYTDMNISDDRHFSFTDKNQINAYPLTDIHYIIFLDKYIIYFSIGDMLAVVCFCIFLYLNFICFNEKIKKIIIKKYK